MFINKINISNFGKLSNFKLEPCQGLNIIYAPNEGGKSTLLHFIKYIFYGSKVKKQSGDISFKEKYTPWSGNVPGGNIEFIVSDEACNIERNGMASTSFSVTDIKNGVERNDILNPGMSFFKMGERAFSDSCYINDLSRGLSGEDGELISYILESCNDKNTYSRINKILTEELLNLSSSKRKNSELSIIDKELNEYYEKKSLTQKRVEELKEKITQNVKNNESSVLLSDDNKRILLDTFDDIKDEISKLRYRRFKSLFFLLASIMGLGSLILFYHKTLCVIFAFFLSLFFGIKYAVNVFGLKKLRQEHDKRRKTKEELMSRFSLNTNEDCIIFCRNTNKTDLKNPISGINYFTNYDINDIILRNELSLCKNELLLLEGEIFLLSAKRQHCMEKSDIVGLAIEILNGAFSNIKESIFPKISKKTFEYFNYITDFAYESLIVDDKFDVILEHDGHYKNHKFLSKGTLDILYFSLRLAIINIMSDDKVSLPIFVDDVLANCDDERAIRVLELICKISEENQIFFATCRRREYEYFKNKDNVKIFCL